jgi:glycosyltransferase involved in cell wall biosynthesis
MPKTRPAHGRALVYCTFDGVANIYHGIGTQTRYLISTLIHQRTEIVDAVGEFDVHLLVPDASFSRPGYAVDGKILAESLQRVDRAQIQLWQLQHDNSMLFHVGKWHQLCSEAAKTIGIITDCYEEVLLVAVDAVYAGLAEHLDHELGTKAWNQIQLVHALYSSARIPGTVFTAGRDELEAACIARANADSRVFLADVGSYFSSHLTQDFNLNPSRLVSLTQALSLSDEEFQPQPTAEAETNAKAWGIPLDRPIVLSLGRADPIKGLDRAILAADPLAERIHFVLIAAPYTPENKEIVKYRRLLGESRLCYTFIPQFDRALPRSLCSLPQTKAVLSASIGEPCGQVPQETALWARLGGPIVIAPAQGGLAAQLRDGVTGLLYEPGDIAAMTKQVERALNMSAERHGVMREAAAAAVMQERDFGTSLKRFLLLMWQRWAIG